MVIPAMLQNICIKSKKNSNSNDLRFKYFSLIFRPPAYIGYALYTFDKKTIGQINLCLKALRYVDCQTTGFFYILILFSRLLTDSGEIRFV